MAKAQAELDKCNVGDGDYAERSRFLEAVIMSCQAVIDYADRYAKLALEMAEKCTDPQRKGSGEGSYQFLGGVSVLLVCAAASPDGV